MAATGGVGVHPSQLSHAATASYASHPQQHILNTLAANFVVQYYQCLFDPAQRSALVSMYHSTCALLTSNLASPSSTPQTDAHKHHHGQQQQHTAKQNSHTPHSKIEEHDLDDDHYVLLLKSTSTPSCSGVGPQSSHQQQQTQMMNNKLSEIEQEVCIRTAMILNLMKAIDAAEDELIVTGVEQGGSTTHQAHSTTVDIFTMNVHLIKCTPTATTNINNNITPVSMMNENFATAALNSNNNGDLAGQLVHLTITGQLSKNICTFHHTIILKVLNTIGLQNAVIVSDVMTILPSSFSSPCTHSAPTTTTTTTRGVGESVRGGCTRHLAAAVGTTTVSLQAVHSWSVSHVTENEGKEEIQGEQKSYHPIPPPHQGCIQQVIVDDDDESESSDGNSTRESTAIGGGKKNGPNNCTAAASTTTPTPTPAAAAVVNVSSSSSGANLKTESISTTTTTTGSTTTMSNTRSATQHNSNKHPHHNNNNDHTTSRSNNNTTSSQNTKPSYPTDTERTQHTHTESYPRTRRGNNNNNNSHSTSRAPPAATSSSHNNNTNIKESKHRSDHRQQQQGGTSSSSTGNPTAAASSSTTAVVRLKGLVTDTPDLRRHIFYVVRHFGWVSHVEVQRHDVRVHFQDVPAAENLMRASLRQGVFVDGVRVLAEYVYDE